MDVILIFKESSKRTVKSINMSKSSIGESTVYQYITLPVSANYNVTAHDRVDGTIITNPSVVFKITTSSLNSDTVLYTHIYTYTLVYTCTKYIKSVCCY